MAVSRTTAGEGLLTGLDGPRSPAIGRSSEPESENLEICGLRAAANNPKRILPDTRPLGFVFGGVAEYSSASSYTQGGLK